MSAGYTERRLGLTCLTPEPFTCRARLDRSVVQREGIEHQHQLGLTCLTPGPVTCWVRLDRSVIKRAFVTWIFGVLAGADLANY